MRRSEPRLASDNRISPQLFIKLTMRPGNRFISWKISVLSVPSVTMFTDFQSALPDLDRIQSLLQTTSEQKLYKTPKLEFSEFF